ncbi:MAG TPA: hypothetical protein VKC53_02015 [Patescibacteria group bacterium]|nr:hypothetical protein [Patescibacteria group bacterium]
MKIKFVGIARFLSTLVLVLSTIVVVLVTFLAGYIRGYAFGKNDQQVTDQQYLSQVVSATTRPIASNAPTIIYITPKPAPKTTWGGPQLWEAVNKRRVELGVNPLQVKDAMCTIASIRLNEILALGQLDGHAGFSKIAERSDIKPTFDKYNVAEFLVSGATSPQNAVDLWENTLGHKELLSGGQYVWGCIYAQDGFGVAIAAF